MDSLIQIALGAAIGGAVLGKSCGRKAVVWGGVLGTLPDLDSFVSWGDAVSNVTLHRSFTHSLFVLLPFSLLLSAVLWGWYSRQKPLEEQSFGFLRLWLMVGLCLVTHPLLDSFTTYGTQLFWPLPYQPVAISSIFIIDPLYTLPLLVGMIMMLVKPGTVSALRWNTAGLILSSLYLVFSFGAKSVVEARLEDTLRAQGKEGAPVFITPMPFNTIVWRAMVLDGDDYLEGTASLFDNEREIKLYRFPRVQVNTVPDLPALKRLEWFTGGFMTLESSHGKLQVTDLRLGLYGQHPFSYLLAKHSKSGDWEPIVPEIAPQKPIAFDGLNRMWQRLTGEPLDVCHISTGYSCQPYHGRSPFK